MTLAIKLMQNLVTEATREESRDTSKFIQANLDNMKNFLARLGTGRIHDVPVRQVGYFALDINTWIQLILDVGLDVFDLDEWIFVYNVFFRLTQTAKVDHGSYIRALDYFQFANSKEMIRSRSQIETFEDYLNSSPETRKRILTRGLSEPLPILFSLDELRQSSSTPTCSSSRK